MEYIISIVRVRSIIRRRPVFVNFQMRVSLSGTLIFCLVPRRVFAYFALVAPVIVARAEFFFFFKRRKRVKIGPESPLNINVARVHLPRRLSRISRLLYEIKDVTF